MILTIGNTKGGVGKTTLAVNLAIARALQGRDVLLVDADSQRTAMTFTDLRTEELGAPAGYTAVALEGANIRNQVRQLAPKYDDIVIDAGGRDTGSLRAALVVSDVVLIPMQPRSFDLWALEQVAELVKEARETSDLRAYVVINAADAQGSDNAQAADGVREVDGLDLLDFTIGDRKAFPNAAATGRSVLEQSPRERNPKAIAELNRLVDAVYSAELAGV